MSRLYDSIKSAVESERFVVSWHADEQCEARKIAPWQIAAHFDDARPIEERPRSRPNPSIILEQLLADGTSVRVVWAWLEQTRRAKLVTVFFPE